MEQRRTARRFGLFQRPAPGVRSASAERATFAAVRRRRTPAVEDVIPDARDGLTRVERLVLHELHALQAERRGRNVPVAQLYGRVVEHLPLTPDELTRILTKLGAGQR